MVVLVFSRASPELDIKELFLLASHVCSRTRRGAVAIVVVVVFVVKQSDAVKGTNSRLRDQAIDEAETLSAPSEGRCGGPRDGVGAPTAGLTDKRSPSARVAFGRKNERNQRK